MLEKRKSENAQKLFGNIAPEFAEITDGILFDKIWEDQTLTPRERSLVTISALVALYRTDQIDFHFKKGIENGLTKDELTAMMTHLAFYTGWPCAVTGILKLKDLFPAKEI